MGYLDAEGHTLVTELTFSHPLHLLAVLNLNAIYASVFIITDFDTNCKWNFYISGKFFSIRFAG